MCVNVVCVNETVIREWELKRSQPNTIDDFGIMMKKKQVRKGGSKKGKNEGKKGARDHMWNESRKVWPGHVII